ncbi:MAG: peptide deformylase [Flavobacteriales bacterium]|nr:peptide deformylase [Flavobacteriales bacterium]MCX7767989.1 peptide deformylase [Flavobacteriales bacterium]
MIHPIYAYGHVVLRKPAAEIPRDYPGLKNLIDDLYETMYHASGVGLAAPQIGQSLRIFVTDGESFSEEDPSVANFKKVFINPVILEEYGDEWLFNEGCLSIPKIREDVERPSWVRVQYYDPHWNLNEEVFTGIAARIIQHETDHLDGILFVDHLPPIRRKLLQNDLKAISQGHVKTSYKMVFPNNKK